MSSGSLADKINLDDFKRLKHYAVFRNETSGVDFLDPIEIDFQGIEDDILYLLVPKTSCQIGHHIHVILMPKIPERKIPHFPDKNLRKNWVAIIGKVKEIDHLTKDKLSIQIKVNQYNMEEVQSIGSSYEKRQGQINDLIDSGNYDDEEDE